MISIAETELLYHLPLAHEICTILEAPQSSVPSCPGTQRGRRGECQDL